MHDGSLLTAERTSSTAPVPVPVVAAGRTPRPVAVAVLAGAGLTVVAAVLAAMRMLPAGSRAGTWRYRYVGWFSWEMLLPFAGGVAAVLALLWLTHRLGTRRERLTVGMWLAAAVPLQLVVRAADEVSLGAIVASDRANSFYSPSLRFGAYEYLTRFADIVHTLPQHARSNMPGKTLLYHLLGVVSTNPAVLGIAITAVSSLGALLVYLLVREVLGDRRVALYALILCLLVPGRLYFLPILNAVSPVPILLALWLFTRYLRAAHWGWAVALGGSLYLVFFFEPLPLVMGLTFAALAALALYRRQLDGFGLLRLVSLTLAAFAAAYLGMRLLFGYDLFVNLAAVLADATDFNERAHRPYDVWVVRNLGDFALCAGFVAVAVLGYATWDAVRRGVLRPIAALTLSGLAVLAFLDLVGINRGETTRLWIFLAVFLMIPVAWVCARSPRVWPFAVVAAAMMLQVATTTPMIAFIRP
ncbi:hypothetical protein Cme02nite_10320 [Catellatospora methionotrophica]|uniref:Glycosyltransferase RgtA/B/C/D-like domain-containing protein n=1 Tax=Catellatospora methionotrophica TaxID=121620 RepID=A0A8J3LDT5_9ACTN|nr:hypothetical protein [Catellatospora methionotrophica]GIG12700.1 hypothetical protein Cme02nite_10320 [Catellatospora methionotrophica]